MWGDDPHIPPTIGPTSPLWGEVLPQRNNWLGLTLQDREALTNVSRPLPVEGPKFHQPTQGITNIKTEPHLGDPLVRNTIQLLGHKRTLDRILETVDTYKQAIASGELDKMPPLAPVPPMPEIIKFHRSIPEDYYQHPLKRLPIPMKEVGESKARAGLRYAVIQLTAHSGYSTSQGSALELLTDSVENYLVNFCNRLRSALDNSLCLAPTEDTGWTDVLERVAVEMGVESNLVSNRYRHSILSVGDYYEEKIVRRHTRLASQCKEKEARYQAELPGEQGCWPSQDEIPEMHFPSSDEGAGLEGDHATPTLDVGMQMLQSLEASGDLDTPLSVAESEVLSGYSATPSPQVSTPGRSQTPHSPADGRSKKRRRSGGKYI